MEIIREDAVWYDFFYTELTTGLRRGEICGLQWRDFDADDGRLKICRAVHEERGGKLTTWDTKTSAGARTITLPPSTVELLRERKKSALTEWIFPHPWKPEQPTHPSTAYDRLKALLKRAELPDIRFHGLHHTFATHALASGVDVRLCLESWDIPGRRSPKTPTHTTRDIQKRAAEIVEEFLKDIFEEELKLWEESEKRRRHRPAEKGRPSQDEKCAGQDQR